MRILIVDQHTLFRDSLTRLLQTAGYEVVGAAGDGAAARAAALRLRPELILMGVALPDLNGVEVVRLIKAQLPDIKIVMLTAFDDEQVLGEAVKAGASGYLLKSLDSGEFLALLQGVLRGELALQPQTVSRLLAGWADQSYGLRPAARLTARELELIHWVARGYSNNAVARELQISPNTVKYHMKSVLQKLGVQNRAEAVAIALRAGWLSPPPSQARKEEL